MNLLQLVEWAKDKSRFQKIKDYPVFCEECLTFVFGGYKLL